MSEDEGGGQAGPRSRLWVWVGWIALVLALIAALVATVRFFYPNVPF